MTRAICVFLSIFDVYVNAANTNPTLYRATRTKIGQATTSKATVQPTISPFRANTDDLEWTGPPQKRVTSQLQMQT